MSWAVHSDSHCMGHLSSIFLIGENCTVNHVFDENILTSLDLQFGSTQENFVVLRQKWFGMRLHASSSVDT